MALSGVLGGSPGLPGAFCVRTESHGQLRGGVAVLGPEASKRKTSPGTAVAQVCDL